MPRVSRKSNDFEDEEEYTPQYRNVEQPRSNFTPVLVILLLIASFFMGMLVTKVQYLQGGSTATAGTTGTTASTGTQPSPVPGAKVTVANGDFPALGDKNAKVKVIEFADFQCPFCKQWFDQTESQLIKDYVNTGKVAFYFRDFAFLGQESNFAGEAAYCANDQGKFWAWHDYLYSHQGQENSGAFSKANLEGFAAAMGLDTNQFNSCLETDKYAKNVTDDTAAGQKATVNGTPTVFVDGIPLVGAQPYTALKAAIDQELAKK